MKKASGLILLLLVGLLVAMPVAAGALGASSETAVSMTGTKLNIQEEVGGILTAESMTALAVPPEALEATITMMLAALATGAFAVNYIRRRAILTLSTTPGAGGDGLFARFS